MYKINESNGIIYFPNGFELAPPYDDERYFEYVDWIQAGNSPEKIESHYLYGLNNVSVSPYQARAAMILSGIYPYVLAALSNQSTPELVKVKFEYATDFKRNDPAVLMMASLLEMTKENLDSLFQQAQGIE